MKLIVTRPAEDAAKLLSTLERLGHDGLVAPMIEISPLANVEVPERDWQAIVVTSANGIRALVGLGESADLLHVPVLAVGPASARAARGAGFGNVTSAEGDLRALTALARRVLRPSGGPVFYPSGTVTSGDLRARLESSGFVCVRLPLYEAAAADRLPPTVGDAVMRGEVDGVLLFSPRSARIWAKCLRKAAPVAAVSRLTHWCLSTAVAAALRNEDPDESRFRNVAVAPEPNEDSLVEALGSG